MRTKINFLSIGLKTRAYENKSDAHRLNNNSVSLSNAPRFIELLWFRHSKKLTIYYF
jgi:hypothetical protein